MKKLITASALCLLMVAIIAVPALAAAQKVDLAPAPVLPPNSGGGFVVFNNSAGPNNLEVTVALKGVAAGATYDIFLFVDGAWYNAAPIGTVTTNKQGNANFHANLALDPGTYDLAIDVALPLPSGADQYLAGFPDGVKMTFK